jgi:hypothetical protein
LRLTLSSRFYDFLLFRWVECWADEHQLTPPSPCPPPHPPTASPPALPCAPATRCSTCAAKTCSMRAARAERCPSRPRRTRPTLTSTQGGLSATPRSTSPSSSPLSPSARRPARATAAVCATGGSSRHTSNPVRRRATHGGRTRTVKKTRTRSALGTQTIWSSSRLRARRRPRPRRCLSQSRMIPRPTIPRPPLRPDPRPTPGLRATTNRDGAQPKRPPTPPLPTRRLPTFTRLHPHRP